jgi:hypothetical protein
VDDPIQKILKKLLATNDPLEFDALSSHLRTMLHERIEKLRKEARSLKPSHATERRNRPRSERNKP